MQLKVIIFFVLYVASWQYSFAQRIVTTIIMENKSDKGTEVVYRSGKQLSLSDFQAEVDLSMHAVAMAYSGVTLKYQAYSKKGELNLEIRLYPSFDKSKSWCLSKAKNEWTLAHEQRHFDITVINACALYRALQQKIFSKDFEKEIAEIQNKYRRINEEEQDQYDSETNHGINKVKQAEWNEYIIRRLAECKDCYE